METQMMKRFKAFAAAAVLGLAASVASAYPDKPVHLVVPYPPGGPVDGVARIVGERLSTAWGQPVIVENRPGASGAIGTEAVIAAPADGTVLLFHSPIMISTELNRPSVRYRTARDLTAVSVVFSSPVFYAASNEATRGNLKEVLAWGAAHPGELSYGSHGDGTTANYMGERLKRISKVEMTHIPFAGDAPILTALMGGHVRTGFLSGSSARRSVDTGKVRVIAVASATRTPLMPEVPTFAEQGFAGFDRESWGMVLAPVSTPKPVVDQIARDIDRIVRQPDVQQRFMAMGLMAKGGSAADAQREVQIDLAFWTRLIEEFGALAQ
jgi:tripartite-type tricarboxylate transporter receptor subunit TctC